MVQRAASPCSIWQGSPCKKAGPKMAGDHARLLNQAENVKSGLQWRPQMLEISCMSEP